MLNKSEKKILEVLELRYRFFNKFAEKLLEAKSDFINSGFEEMYLDLNGEFEIGQFPTWSQFRIVGKIRKFRESGEIRESGEAREGCRWWQSKQ